jgi:ankyrin repeat-rich membrane spanning protein
MCYLQPDVLETKLSTLNVDGVCDLLTKIDDVSSSFLPSYTSVIRENNINGRVLLHCDLDELKRVCLPVNLINSIQISSGSCNYCTL